MQHFQSLERRVSLILQMDGIKTTFIGLSTPVKYDGGSHQLHKKNEKATKAGAVAAFNVRCVTV